MNTPFNKDDEIKAQMKAMEQQEEEQKFTNLLVSNKLTTPNEFTRKMGELIRQAREKMGMSQADLAKALNKRKATISDIENGKSEIGVLTLAGFALELHKPISYFFPESLLKNYIADVKSTFEHEVVEIARQIEEFQGDEQIAIELLKVIKSRAEIDFFKSMDEQDEP
jgi:transcriptional regulator with XRE-family HTH domain